MCQTIAWTCFESNCTSPALPQLKHCSAKRDWIKYAKEHNLPTDKLVCASYETIEQKSGEESHRCRLHQKEAEDKCEELRRQSYYAEASMGSEFRTPWKCFCNGGNEVHGSEEEQQWQREYILTHEGDGMAVAEETGE